MNLSPSEDTNHTDSLSTSYDTSADPNSLNATTPGMGMSLPDDTIIPPVSNILPVKSFLSSQLKAKSHTFLILCLDIGQRIKSYATLLK